MLSPVARREASVFCVLTRREVLGEGGEILVTTEKKSRKREKLKRKKLKRKILKEKEEKTEPRPATTTAGSPVPLPSSADLMNVSPELWRSPS
jgi:hypothetical protein